MIRIYVLSLILGYGRCQLYDCPLAWETYQQTCYFFNYAPQQDYAGAQESCHEHGATLVSVNNAQEHSFIVQQLGLQDAYGYSWYTSGIVNDITTWDMKWEGDGSKINPELQIWYSEQDRVLNFRRIVYKTEGGKYGWSRVAVSAVLPFICEISQAEAYRINADNRDFTYGLNLTDPKMAPRGPFFMVQPHNIVVVADSRSTSEGEHFSVSIECFADGNPLPEYTIYHTNTKGFNEEVTSDSDSRYTVTGGSLVILNPVETLDAGIFQCLATNQYGAALSDMANITFGALEAFSNVQRAPVVAEEYQSAAIECDPPQYKPDISFQWYRGVNSDFVRPDLNPYIFISSNGKLYFSEVTQNDESDYNCIVKLTSGYNAIMNTDQPPSRVSLPIALQIKHQVPATWGPVIADGFIATFPNKPLQGQTVKLECLAYGTLPLIYSWSRKDFSLPDNTQLSDHNRILEIPDVKLEDTGTYYCDVVRDTGSRVRAVHHLEIETQPYFVFPLPHQHADIGGQLTWRCEAKAIPKAIYFWYKNGVELHSVPGDIDIRSNVMTIRNLDPAKHDGVYQCTAFNTHGVTYSTAQLRVLAFPPSFQKNPLNPSQSGALGGDITIICSPEASPKPDYIWKKNNIDMNIPENDETSRIRKLANGNLYISNIQYADAGRYGCMATNTYGSDISYSELTVVANTVITMSPSSTVGKINQTSVMLCEASFPSNIDHIYEWQLNGRDIEIQNHPHYRLGTAQYRGALYVTSAQYDHTGMYTCIAKTTYDETSASAYLTIEGPPGEPAGVRVDPTTITPTSATVIWIEGATHGRPVDFHTVEGCTKYNKTWVTLAPNIPITVSQLLGTDKHAFITGYLKPGNGYQFRVLAINALGVGIASFPSSVYQIPGAPPSHYPDDVGGGGGSVGLLTITWKPLPPDEQGGPGIGYIVSWRLKGTSTKFLEIVLEGDVGQHVVTVGRNNYYLEYEVKVTPFNVLGPGPSSPEGVYIFSAEDIPIGVATNIYAFAYNSTALKVSWQIVTNDREHMRGTLLGYQVNFKLRYVPDASLDAISWRGETHDGIVIGLDPYTWYTVDVQILNTAGMGPRSEVFHAKTYKSAPILYATEIMVYSHSKESVRIKWRGVSTSIREENLEGYKVRYWQSTDDIRSATDVETEKEVTSVIIYGIQKDIVYKCRILGYSRGGDGKHSEAIYFTLGGMVPFDPSTSEIMASSDKPSIQVALCTLSLIIIQLWLVIMF